MGPQATPSLAVIRLSSMSRILGNIFSHSCYINIQTYRWSKCPPYPQLPREFRLPGKEGCDVTDLSSSGVASGAEWPPPIPPPAAVTEYLRQGNL